MRHLVVLSLTTLIVFVLLLPTVACSSELSDEEACAKFKKACGSATGGVGGSTTTLSATCDPAELRKLKNRSDVKECLDSTTDCNAAVGCLLNGER
jgi:hypothetical protein